MTQVVVIGGGHNGLVCSCYLAKAGFEVTVLERRHQVGGAAVTEEFYPGFRNSTASYTVSLLHPKVIRDLNLVAHGLRIVSRTVNNFLPLPNGEGLLLYPDLARSVQEMKRFSARDADQLPEYYDWLHRVTAVVRELLMQTPPEARARAISDGLDLLRVGKLFRALSRSDQQSMLQLVARSPAELLSARFESDAAKALLGFDAVIGNFASPFTPGIAYLLLHLGLGETNGVAGSWGHPLGGMGAISDSILREATTLGVAVRTGESVKRISVQGGRAVGVETDSGELITADVVVANVDPKRLFLNLIEADELEPEVVEHFSNYQCSSGSFRINVALSALPEFHSQAVQRDPRCLQSGIVIAPSLEYMDRAYHSAREDGWSREPVVEMVIPSTIDDSLAPSGHHVASLFCQHFDPAIDGGWDQAKDAAADTIIGLVDQYAGNFRSSILGMSVLSPLDLEREFGLTGGDIFHGRMVLDQLYAARPMLGMGSYRAPIEGLYLCGSGTHPGGGVSGVPGHNAARVIVADHQTGWRRWFSRKRI